MGTLLWALDLLAIAFGIHAAWWMSRPPARRARALAAVFFGTPAAIMIVATALNISWFPHGAHSIISLVLFCGFTGMAYIMTYFAVEADSPTLRIAILVEEAASAGLAEADLYAMLSESVLLKPRLDELVRDGLAMLSDDGRYRITAKGERLARLATGYRRRLGLEVKGG